MNSQDIKRNYKILKVIAENYGIPIQLVVKLYQDDTIRLPIVSKDNAILEIFEKILNNKDILDRLVWKRLSKIRKSRRLDYINTLRFNKLERYVYTRLINAYRSGKKISNKQLITELSQYYKIPISGESDTNVLNYNRLKHIVKKIRWVAYHETHRATSATRGDCLR